MSDDAKYICKYAGDKEDEDCVNCNGIKMEIDGKEYDCTECAGYEQGEQLKKEPKKSAQKQKKKKKEENSTSNEENRENERKSTSCEEETQVIDGVKVTSLRYMSGITIVHKDNYYKFTAEEEWQVNEDELKEDLETVREKLWVKLNSEIDKQVEEVFEL